MTEAALLLPITGTLLDTASIIVFLVLVGLVWHRKE